MASYPEWQPQTKTLTGTSRLIAGEVYKIIIPANGYQIKNCTAGNATSEKVLPDKANSIYEMRITKDATAEVTWKLNFDKLK